MVNHKTMTQKRIDRISLRTAITIAIASFLFIQLTSCERQCYRTGADVFAIDSIIDGQSRYSETKEPIVWDCDQAIEGISQHTIDTVYKSQDTTIIHHEFIRFRPRP